MDFNQIPIDLNIAGQFVEFNNSRAARSGAGMPSRILVIGQGLAGGIATALTATRIESPAHSGVLHGWGSMLHGMITTLRAANAWTELWAIMVPDDAAGQAAAGAVTVSAPASAAGTLALYIAGRRVRVGVAAGQATTAVATALAAAINADGDLPVVAAVDGVNASKVNITCRWKGETGNDLDLRVNHYQDEVLPTGLVVTKAAMAGGTANPDIEDALAAVAATWFTDVCCPYTDAANLASLDAEGERRFGGTVMTEMHAYTGRVGSYGELATFGDARNGPHVTHIGAQGSPTPPWEWAAALTGICAFEAKQDPARPYQTLSLPRKRVLAPAQADQFDPMTRNLLVKDGISGWWAGDDGTVYLDNIITTYQRNPYGLEDSSYRQVETMKTLGFMRYSMRARIAQRFPRHKLASDTTPRKAGDFMVRPKDIRNELIALAEQEWLGKVLENIDQFVAELMVERDEDNRNRANALVPPDLINQFRVFAARVDFIV